MTLYKLPSISTNDPVWNPVRTLLHPIRALTGGHSAPALAFDPLKPNQTILFSGVGGAGVPYVIKGIRQRYLEGRGAVLEFGFDGEGGARHLQESLESVGHRNAPVTIRPTLDVLKYPSTILNAIEARSCLFWEVPYGWDQNPLPIALAEVFRLLLKTRPSQQGRLLLILDEMMFRDFDDLERVVSLAHKTGASVWVSTGSLTRHEQELSRLKELFNSFLIFRQDGLEGSELAINFCNSVVHAGIDVRANLTPRELTNAKPGRFVCVNRDYLEVGEMSLPRTRA